MTCTTEYIAVGLFLLSVTGVYYNKAALSASPTHDLVHVILQLTDKLAENALTRRHRAHLTVGNKTEEPRKWHSL